MKKLIEVTNEHLVVCDNPICDYVVVNETGDPNASIAEYLNKHCPLCGQNLLTEEDYLGSLKVMRVINWINKYFSWITFFIPAKTKEQESTVHYHNGIKIETNKL